MTLAWPITLSELHDGDLTLLPWNRVNEIPEVMDDLIVASNDQRMQRYTHVPEGYTASMAESFLGEDEAVRWALVEDGRYCGNIGLRLDHLDFAHVSVGYATAPWARGKGLMTRALRLVRDYAFAHGVFRFQVKAEVNNVASRHVAESAGFIFEGVQRGGEILRGKANDLAVYALLATDKVSD